VSTVRGPDTISSNLSMEDLSLVLWRERELLETLLYKLEVEKLILATHSTRWLAAAAREVELVLETVRETEVLRAVAADAAAASVGLPSNPSLRALADAVGEPWHTILLDHHKAFVACTRELVDTAAANRELLTAGQQAAREVFLDLAEHPAGYSPTGSAVTGEPRQHVIDRSI
jgi:choline dehydrogenase-like flavoprotein